ncbi:reverse transcriptase [Phytophthora megakarya]|uniref:Reverse transcriptase n=1 Tax=Phytophthora megakarya TaxID=4795 RepID=A0A225WT68_9STRA|nr:reverse transcriptase [Phytophthora megakarya]
MDEATKVVTFMKWLRDGPVTTYLFREYPSTLEAAITLTTQEELSLRQAKVHTNQKNKGSYVRCFRCENMGHYAPRLHEAGRDQAGLDDSCPRVQEPAGDHPQTGMSAGGIKEHSSVAGLGRNARESGIHKKERRRKHKTLRKSRSGTETLQGMSAGQAQEPTVAVETFNVSTRACAGCQYKKMVLENPPTDTAEVTSLPVMSWKRFAKDLEDTFSAKTKKEHFEEQSWDSLKSSLYYEILREHRDVLPDEIPAELPQGKGIQHEIDLVPGTKYCVTRQWPLPREQVKTIDDFFESRRKAGQAPHSAPTFCVKKPQGGWRIVHACVTHLLRSVRDFAPSYFDNVKTDIEMHKEHLRQLLGLMRKHKLYANLKKCIFGASEIPVLGCLVGKNGVRPNPEKVRVINEWPTPSSVKELRQFIGLATYLCKYVDNYAGKIRPLSQFLKKEAAWEWTAECQQAFDAVKLGLTEAPILAVADQDRPFHVVCDASDFAIGCALMQLNHEGRDRDVYYQSRQLKPAERNYPVHDKELLAMKYTLAKFRVYLLGNTPFVVYTDHATLRTAVKSPHISQRMVRWLSFFVEYNFRVEYKPGRLNVVADALSRRPDYAVRTIDVHRIDVARTYTPSSSSLDEVKAACTNAKQLIEFLSAPSDKPRRKLAPRLRAGAHRYRVHDGLLFYSAVDDNAIRIVVPSDPNLRSRIMYEYHDVPTAGHPGREKPYSLLMRDFYWNHQTTSTSGCATEVTSVQTARLFVDMVFKHHGMPSEFVSGRDLHFTARFWQKVFTLLGTQFSMSTADHLQTDGQSERVNCVLVDLLKSYARARTRQGDVSTVPGTDSVKNNEQATPASSKDNVSVRGTDTEKTHAQAGPVARTSDVSMPGIDTEKLHAQARPAAITHKVSMPGTDTTKSHAQSGTDANTSGGSVQGTDADKVNELDSGFSSQAMDFVQERQAGKHK